MLLLLEELKQFHGAFLAKKILDIYGRIALLAATTFCYNTLRTYKDAKVHNMNTLEPFVSAIEVQLWNVWVCQLWE